MQSFKTIREQAYEANVQLPALGLVRFTFGNVSAADPSQGVFAIKPSGVAYELLRPEQMVIVDFEGQIIDGKLRPSSDTATHAVLYQHLTGIGGICHTHSTYATSWAQARKAIPLFGTTHADHLVCDVPCAPHLPDEAIKENYELATGYQILKHLKLKKLDYREVEMILVGSHAPFTWGKTAEKAVYNSAVLENIAHMAYLTRAINPMAARLKKSIINKHYERKHGAAAYYGQPATIPIL